MSRYQNLVNSVQVLDADSINSSLRNPIQQISIFCQEQRLSRSFQSQLINKFQSSPGIHEPIKFCKSQLDRKIREQIMRSIFNFVQFLDSKNALKIEVVNNQLDLNCRVRIDGTIGYSNHGIVQIKTLEETMYSKFYLIKQSRSDIHALIQKMFQKLYECFKIFLKKHNQSNFHENNFIDQINFFMFRSNYLIDNKKQYEGKYQPILIGGLANCCYRFFRVLFQFFFSYAKLFLLPDVKKRTNEFCTSNQRFCQNFMQYISKSLEEIKKFQRRSAREIQNLINQQMLEFKYKKVFQYFLQRQLDYESRQSIDIYQQTLRLYRSQKIISKIQNVEVQQTTISQQQRSEPKLFKFMIKGHITPNKNNDSIKQLDLKKIICSGFGKYFNVQYDESENYFFIQGFKKIHKTQIQIRKSGQFEIVTKVQNDYDQFMKYIRKVYHLSQIVENERTQVLKGSLGLSNLDLKSIAQIIQFQGKIDLLTSQRQEQIFQKRLKDYKDNLNHRKRTDAIKEIQRKQGQQQQQLPNMYRQMSQNVSNNKEQFQTRLHEINLNDKIKYIIYKFSKTIPLENEMKSYKQKMRMSITQNGQVKIYNVKDEKYAIEQFRYVQKKIRQCIQKNRIRKLNQNEKILRVNKLSDMFITCEPNQSQLDYNTTFTDRIGSNRIFKISSRGVKTYEQRSFIVRDQLSFQPIKKLKVLTWNIQGSRKNTYYIQNPTEQEKKQILRMEQERFICIINLINIHDPDIICLQEAQCLYRNKDLFQNLLVKRLDSNTHYYYAEYVQNTNDLGSQQLLNSSSIRQTINDRTIILSKYPGKFSHLNFQYNNFPNVQPNNLNQSYQCQKSTILLQFKLRMNLDIQRELNVLVASVHLKSGEGRNQNLVRKFMFEGLNYLANDFDICILAGDFNTYDEPLERQFDNLSPVAQKIISQKYVNLQDYLVSKDYSYVKGTYQPSIMDKIILKFKQPQVKNRLNVLDIRFPGSFSMEHLTGQNYATLTYKDKIVRTLSDHIGRYAQFGFDK